VIWNLGGPRRTTAIRDPTVYLWLALVTIAARLGLSLIFFGTGDVYNCRIIGRALLDGENIYALGAVNWPPTWAFVTAGAVYVHDSLGLPFSPIVKLLPTLADAAIATLIYRAGIRLCWTRAMSMRAGLAYGLSPVAILITGGHGQFDALMVLCCVVGWCCWQFWTGRNASRRAACRGRRHRIQAGTPRPVTSVVVSAL
jgi:hypothetical protein